MFMVESVGRSGGLALLWSDEISLEIQNYSCRHTNAKITSSVNVLEWKFKGFYGHLKLINDTKHGVYFVILSC